MSDLDKSKLNITVLVSSYSQRDITIETALYYSRICSEVILVDEQKPFLSESETNSLKNKNIKYEEYENNNTQMSVYSVYEKRLIAASKSKNKYVVHSNHDERYTYNGLQACLKELENDSGLIFCSGQAIAVRKDNFIIHYSRSYENLNEYENINSIQERLLHHSGQYAPIAHYSLWRKKYYISVTEKTMQIHKTIPTKTIMEEVIFELAADIAGNSKAISQLYWIRNRVNSITHNYNEKGDHVFKTIENKLQLLLADVDNVDSKNIIKNFRANFLFVNISLFKRILNSLKRWLKERTKFKKVIRDANILLIRNNIIYEKEDLDMTLSSMNL